MSKFEKIDTVMWVVMGAVILIGAMLPYICQIAGVSYWFITEEFTDLFRYPVCVWLLFSLRTIPRLSAELAYRPMSRREEERMFAMLQQMGRKKNV